MVEGRTMDAAVAWHPREPRSQGARRIARRAKSCSAGQAPRDTMTRPRHMSRDTVTDDEAGAGVDCPVVRDLPPPPTSLWRIVGPGVVASGVGLSSGEFVLWPYIASQVGLVFLWGAVLGVVTQFFINMEIERYTLATGETVLAGFSRLWRHAGLVFVHHGLLRESLAGMGDECGHALHVCLRRRRALHRDGVAAGHRRRPDARARGLRGTRATRLRQGRCRPRPRRARRRARHPRRHVGRPRVGLRAHRDGSRAPSTSPCCSAPWPSPVPAAARTSARATGSATRASGWASTCPASSAPSPGRRSRRPAPCASPSPPRPRTWPAGRAGGALRTSSRRSRSPP